MKQDIGAILKTLNKSKNAFDSALLSLENALSDKCEFEFFITYQTSDASFMIVSEAFGNGNAPGNAPLLSCLKVIKEKGCLSLNDYLTLTI